MGDESYLLNVGLYIHLNPIRAGIVDDLRKYKWSSYHDYVGIKKAHSCIDSESVLKEFGRNKQESKAEYRKLIRAISGKEKEFLEDLRHGMILGSDKFVKWVQREFIDRKSKKDKELPQKQRVSDVGIQEKVINEILTSYKMEKVLLLKRRRLESNEARDVCMHILKNRTGLKNKEIGEVFGVSESAVNKASLRLNARIKTQKHLKKRIEAIINSVFINSVFKV